MRALRVLIPAFVLMISMTGCRGLSDISAPRPVEVPVSSVEVSTPLATLGEGGTLALQATARDAANRLLADRSVTWSTSDASVALVSEVGLVTAVRTGSAQVAASIDGKSAVTLVTVTARAVASIQIAAPSTSILVGGFSIFQATTLDDGGNIISGRPVFWATSDSRIAVVDATGRVSGISAGSATVTATSASRTAAVGVTVLPVPVATVQVSPARDTVVVGQGTQLVAIPRDSTGARLDDLVTWSSSNANVATVSSAGLVMGVNPGTVTVTASSGGKFNTAVVVVQPRPVGAVIVSPSQSSLTVGQTVRLTVQITDGSGNLLSGRPTSYSSSNSNIAQVATDGLVSAAAPGTVTITVTSEGKVGTAAITVSSSPVASVRVQPASATVQVGATVTLEAVALDAGGTVLAQRPVTFTSGAPSVVTVTAVGLVTGVGPGSALVFVAAEGRLTTAAITVPGTGPTTLSVVPANPTIIFGETVDLTAVYRNASGQEVSGPPVQWSSSNNAVAVVSSSGRVRGVGIGSVRIDASADGFVASSSTTVAPVPVAAVSVNLASSALLVGRTTQVTAIARDRNDNVITGRAVTWSSANTAVATVSATGLVTAISLGTSAIRATVEGIVGSATVSVVVGSASVIAANSAVTQSAAAGTSVSAPPSVKVTDESGTPVSGVSVTFAVTGGGGSISPSSPASVTTNASGIATLTGWTLGVVAGSNTVTGSVSGLTGSPVTFTASGTIGAASRIDPNSPTSQFTTVGTAVASPPSVKVVDAAGNAVSGVAVTFTVTSGGGTIAPNSPAVVATNASGVATLTRWTVGSSSGGNSVSASANGLTGSPIVFTATASAGAATTIAAVSSTSQVGQAGRTVAAAPSVKVTDANGNPVSGVGVRFTVTNGNGSIAPSSPAIVMTNASGLASLSSWTLGNSVGTNTVLAAVTSLSGSPVTFNAVATPRAAASMSALSPTTQATTAGTAVGSPPRVLVVDDLNNPVGDIGVTFTVTGGGGSIVPGSPASVNTDASGVASLTGWTTGSVAGSNAVSAASSGLAGSPVTFAATGTVGSAGQLAITTQPNGAVSGAPFTTQPVVEVRDGNGNRLNSTAAVTVTKATGTGTLSGTMVVNAVNGVATFTNLVITGVGAHTLQFSTSSPVLSVTSGSFTAVAGAPTAIAAVSSQSQSATVGTAVSAPPSVRVTDAGGNPVSGVNVTFNVPTGGGSLVPTSPASIVTNASGLATLTSWTLGAAAGANSVTASAAGLSGSPVVFNATGTSGAAGLLVVTRQPAGAVSGAAFTTQPRMEIRDAGGNLTNSTATVTASIASGTGSLSGTVSVAAVAGVATFTNLQITGSGAHTLQFATTSPALTVTSSSFTVAAGAATQLVVTQQPAGATSGAAFTTQPRIEIRDAGGTLTSSTATVTATVVSGTGTLGGTVSVAAVAGVATFTNLQITGSGAHTLKFATTTPALNVNSSSFTVAAGTATQLAVTQQPAGATSGAAFTTQPRIEIRDAGGNLTNSTATVTATIQSGTGALSGTVSVAAVAGVATFTNLQITGSGAHTLRFATTSPALNVTSSSFTVSAGAATQLVVTQQPAGATSTVPFTTQPRIEIRDAGGNLTNSTATVTATVASGTGTLSGTVSVAAVAGVATFTNLKIDDSGAHTLRFATTSPALNVNSSSFTVAVGAAAQLAVTQQPAGATSGTAFTTQPRIEIRDAGGNLTSSTATVTATVTSGTGTLGGTVSVAAVAGVATFTNLQIVGSGAHTLRFATTSPALNVNSASFTVAAGPPSQLVVTRQPAGAVSGDPFTTQPRIEIRDAGGNLTNSTATVTATVTSGTGTLSGTVSVAAVAGVATFTNLQIDDSGAYTLQFATTAPVLTVNSASFTVAAGAPAQLVVTRQPAGAVDRADFDIQPRIEIRDAYGNLTNSTVTVTAAIASGSGNLRGGKSVNAVAGIATFTNLKIDGTGGHTLRFSTTSPQLFVVSVAFTVEAGELLQTEIAVEGGP